MMVQLRCTSTMVGHNPSLLLFLQEAFPGSLACHEHYLASKMVLHPGMRVLDVGCSVGGLAHEIAQFTDARIIGLNKFQIGRARKYTKLIFLMVSSILN